MLLAPFCRFFVNLIKKSLTICLWGNLLLSVEKSSDGSRFYFFVWKLKKSGTRTPWNSRRWFLARMMSGLSAERT